MKAEMCKDGVIIIKAESPIESYALRKWHESSSIEVLDDLRMLTHHIDPRKIMVDFGVSGDSES